MIPFVLVYCTVLWRICLFGFLMLFVIGCVRVALDLVVGILNGAMAGCDFGI